jgi:hypothetical protein
MIGVALLPFDVCYGRYSKKCDSAQPTLCSDFYHSQEQSPGYPHGDGDCLAPGCDCGSVPCGFYVWNHSSTAIVNGQSFQDWFINSYVLNEVGRSPLVSGYFWDDVWNPQCVPCFKLYNVVIDSVISHALVAVFASSVRSLRVYFPCRIHRFSVCYHHSLSLWFLSCITDVTFTTKRRTRAKTWV